MAKELNVGDVAPNFDLSSTEGVLLMLCDEVPRNLVVLYFFSDPASDSARADLTALAAARDGFAAKRVNILGIAPVKLPELNALQAELGLPFPLLRDDRAFSAAYGVEPAGEETPGGSALVLVGRDQKVRWLRNSGGSVESQLGELTAAIDAKQSPTHNYPKSVINRLVDRWVN
jgi:peroxiredoxin